MKKEYTVIFNDCDGEQRCRERQGKGRKYIVIEWNQKTNAYGHPVPFAEAMRIAARWNREPK